MRSEPFLSRLSRTAFDLGRSKRISLDKAIEMAMDDFKIQSPSERIMFATDAQKRIQKHNLIKELLVGMTNRAAEVYHEHLDIPAAATVAVKEYTPLLNKNRLRGAKWEKFFHARICRRLAYRSHAVQRAKKKAKESAKNSKVSKMGVAASATVRPSSSPDGRKKDRKARPRQPKKGQMNLTYP